MPTLTSIRELFSIRGPRPKERHVRGLFTALIGVALALVGIGLIASILEIWPTVDRGKASETKEVGATLFLGVHTIKLTQSTGLFLLAVLAGALGAYIHTVTSFVTYVGNRTLRASWLWWYGLRMLVGATLALLLYFAFRGGLLTAQGSTQAVNPYGVAALSGLAGLFSKQATDKLKEVFDVFFRTSAGQGDETRADKVEGGPVIKELVPNEVSVGETPELRVLGSGFESGAAVLVGDQERPTDFVTADELKTMLQASDTQTAGSLGIRVKNPDGLLSSAVVLTISP